MNWLRLKTWQVVSIFAVLSAMLIPLSADAASNPKGIPASAVAFSVKDHIDGDSFHVGTDDGEEQRVDLVGIDAPELNRSRPECYAKESADRLATLLPKGSTVYLEDEEIDDDDKAWKRDVWIEGKEGGKATLLNTKLVREGFAGYEESGDHDLKYADRLSTAEDDAREDGRGLWDECGGIHEKVPPTPTPVPTPTPSDEEIKAQYVPLADVRELAIRPGGMMDQKIFFYGTIQTIGVAPPGYVYTLGDSDEHAYGAQLQVSIAAPDGSSEFVFVGFNGDTAGMFEGSWVVVYGTVVDTETFQNALGGYVSQPLVAAEFVELA
jgi:endonuclease YncB( thermonuclease family)